MRHYDRTKNRFAFYLLPPFSLVRDVDDVHRVLKKEFGLEAAGRFQVHATIKGFFKMRSGKDPMELQKELDQCLLDWKAFPVRVCHDLRVDEIGVGLNLEDEGEDHSRGLMGIREAIVDCILPYIDDDCDFSAEDLKNPFKAHITLAFRDITQDIQQPVLDYISEALPDLQRSFTARDFQFVEYCSERWEHDWWTDLTWKRLKHWRLPE